MKTLMPLIICLEVSKRGSFVAAADFLGLSTPSVSKTVRKLEAELQVKLFQRSTRRVSVTEEGKRFLSECAELVDSLQRLKSEFQDPSASLTGPLKLNTPHTLGTRVLLPRILRFQREYPKIRLEMSHDNRVSDLIEEKIDLAVRTGNLADKANLIATRWFSYQSILVTSPKHLKPRTLDELEELPQVRFRLPGKGRWAGWRFQSEGEEFFYRGTASLVLEELGSVCAALCDGAGYGMLPSWACVEELRRGELVEVLPQLRPLETPVWLVYHDRRHLSPKVSLFIDVLKRDTITLDELYLLKSDL